MKQFRPNQSGTFSNRTNFHNEDDQKMFVIEMHIDDNKERAEIISLIAAAPDLLKSCNELLDFLKDVTPSCAAGDDQLQYLRASAKKAIDKALGND